MSAEQIPRIEIVNNTDLIKLQQGERQEAALAEIDREREAEKEKNNHFKIVSHSGKEIGEMNIHESPYILSPWLREGNIAMISAKAGIGKTFLSLEISRAITTGTSIFDGRWEASSKRSLLYIDGEMSQSVMRKRIENFGLLDNENFRLVNPDFSPDSLSININRIEWQESILQEIDKRNSQVLILDNVASLYRTDKTNASESWLIMQDFLLTLRKKKIAVILVDHQGKGEEGGARGTSAKEDILDTSISLKTPDGYKKEMGCRFEIHFRKARDFYGEEVKPFEVSLYDREWGTAEISDSVITGRKDSEKFEETKQAVRDGKTLAECLDSRICKKDMYYRAQKAVNAENEYTNDPNCGNINIEDE